MPKANVSVVVQDNSGKTVLYWYDPMTPGQKFDKPGKSPFMDMQLEPKYAEKNSANDGNSEDGGVKISSQTMQNLGIRLEKVTIKSFGDSLSTFILGTNPYSWFCGAIISARCGRPCEQRSENS
jgi:Cu(I)/Ag(I) efflux system membrane fusion protein